MIKQKTGVFLAYFMQFLIGVYLVISILNKDYIGIFWGVVILFMTFIPLIIKRKWKITLPWTLNFLLVLTLFMHAAGEMRGWYVSFYPFYDKIGHFIGSITVALLGFTSVLIIDKYTKINLTKNSLIFFVVVFTLAIGAFWEIAEFIVDQLLKTTTQFGSLNDTMIDLIFDLLGGLIVGIFIHLKYSEKDKSRIVKSILNLNKPIKKWKIRKQFQK